MASKEDDPTVRHAFMLVGHDGTLLATHLPMLHMDAHAYHLVLSATLPEKALATYLADRAQHPDAGYWIANDADDEMHLPEIIDGSRTSFQASIWRGIPDRPAYMEWPWAGIDPVVSGAKLTISKVLFSCHFDQTDAYETHLRYILFGDDTTAYLHHRMVKNPDFDHLVALNQPPAGFGGAGPTATLVTLPSVERPKGSTPCSNELKPRTYQAETSGGKNLDVAIGSTIWYSTKQLTPNLPDPCA